MKKTKIICTMGPAISDREILKQLITNGMDIARFNFSHGTYEEHKERMNLVKSVREELGVPVAILLDTKGPEIRTGVLKDGKKVLLREGDTFTLTTEDLVGDEKKVHITYDGLVDDVDIGNTILIDDGLIALTVKNICGSEIQCTVVNGGELGERKGINVPNVSVRLPGLTEKDREDIIFGISQDIDFIAASFVRSAESILEIRSLLKEQGRPGLPIIAKIENAEGIKNIDEIIHCADGIMVARGDLGVEISAEKVPYLQKLIIQKCNDNFKPVITATQMLDSMIRNPRPTRAEVTDVANAVYDGTDAVMLSGETAMGKYPAEAVRMMAHIVESTEEHLDYELLLEKKKNSRMKSIATAVGYSSVTTAYNLQAKCIITPTMSGATARLVSKFKPKADIIGVSPSEHSLRKMQLYWGVRPMKSVELSSTEDIVNGAITLAEAKGMVEGGDVIVMTAGLPAPNTNNVYDRGGASNMMRVAIV